MITMSSVGDEFVIWRRLVRSPDTALPETYGDQGRAFSRRVNGFLTHDEGVVLTQYGISDVELTVQDDHRRVVAGAEDEATFRTDQPEMTLDHAVGRLTRFRE